VLKVSFQIAFSDNTDHGSIYCKMREMYSFTSPSLIESGEILWPPPSLDEHRKGRNRERWLWWSHRRICFDEVFFINMP